jgi:catechol 2,3-dioxygenase-like lactoylglutathione lyase family enzyme
MDAIDVTAVLNRLTDRGGEPMALCPAGIWTPTSHPPWKANMVWWMDHIGLLVSDLARAKNFYGACLAPLGWQFRDYGARGGVFRNASSPPFYLTPASTDTRGLHLAFRASSREQVEAFHRAALAQGATDNGPPGLRPDYGDGYFAAFVLDTSGNNLEAVHLESVEREA